MTSGARELISSLARWAGGVVAALSTRRRLAIVTAMAGCAVLALVAAGVVPGSGPRAVRRHHPPAPVASTAAGDQGAPGAVAFPAILVPDTAVTVAPAPKPVPHPAPGLGATGGTPAPSHATPPPARPSYPKPKPEPNRSAPAQPPPPTPAPGAVIAGDFPDPAVLRVGAVYYAYSTEVGATSIPVIRSVDLVHWETVGNGLANLPAWSSGASVWAPSVVHSASGYVVFYSTRDNRTGDQCISRAVSILPQGPFVDMSANPFECQLNLGGSIDPDAFVDDNGAQWLIWKSQGTAGGRPPQLWAQPMGGDWRYLVGQPVPLLSVDQRWENGVVEAPTMARVGKLYYLLYSGNYWDTGSYGVGYAVCRTVTGPCSKPRAGPVLASHGTEEGPGSGSVFTDGLGRLRIAYHAWTVPHVGYPGGQRSLHLGTVTLAGGQLSISEP